MNWKIGQVLYGVYVDDETGKCELEEHIVRTIRGGRVYAIHKNSLTWGKLSTKHGDFGFLPNIPDWCRTAWRVDGAPSFIHTTKLKAIRAELKGRFYIDDPVILEKAKRTLRAMETRNRKK
jgi:hypothetical protein